jgi:hypothetical protein
MLHLQLETNCFNPIIECWIWRTHLCLDHKTYCMRSPYVCTLFVLIDSLPSHYFGPSSSPPCMTIWLTQISETEFVTMLLNYPCMKQRMVYATKCLKQSSIEEECCFRTSTQAFLFICRSSCVCTLWAKWQSKNVQLCAPQRCKQSSKRFVELSLWFMMFALAIFLFSLLV